MAESLRGNLTTFRLPEVLTFLSTTRKSGTLTLTNESSEASVFFDNGAVVFAASNQEQLRLGAVLQRRHRISPAQREAIDALMRKDGGHFGQLAIQQGMLSEEQLRDFLKVQVSEILYDCFVWRGGEFSFSDELQLPPYAVTISIDLANLIMEGARRIAEWEECLRLLPDNTVVFRVVSNPEAEKITLSLDEWKILFLINGQRTLQELAEICQEDPFHLYRVVYGLFANKLIEPADAMAKQDDTGRARPITPEDTMRQPPVTFGADSTVREVADDTSLLVSSDANLSYHDVVRTTVAQLSFLTGEDSGLIIPLTEAEYLIGRQRDNQIHVPDLGVSGHHARIYRAPEGYAIEDLKSRNGTWINSARTFHTLLKTGDQLRLGATEMIYEVLYDGARAAENASRAATREGGR